MTDDESARSTSTPTVRTAAATAARRQARAGRIALELACRLDELDDERLIELAGLLVDECVKRGVAARIYAEPRRSDRPRRPGTPRTISGG